MRVRRASGVRDFCDSAVIERRVSRKPKIAIKADIAPQKYVGEAAASVIC